MFKSYWVATCRYYIHVNSAEGMRLSGFVVAELQNLWKDAIVANNAYRVCVCSVRRAMLTDSPRQ